MRWNPDRRNDPRRPACWALLTIVAVSLAGCGPNVQPMSSKDFYPVKGKVTLPDGKPLAGVGVVFTGPYMAIAPTESDGTFTVKGEKDGLPAGEYKVHLEGTGSKSAKRVVMPFPSKYLDEDASGLTAKVTPEGPNDFDFKLTKGEAKADAPRGGH